MRGTKLKLLLLAVVIATPSSLNAQSPEQSCLNTSTGFPPLTHLADEPYLGTVPLGLFPGVRNHPPTVHGTEGAKRALGIRPLDASGNDNSAGKIVLMSVGMSNTSIEFHQFVSRAAADFAVNHVDLEIVDAAQGGQSAAFWESQNASAYDVAAQRLASRGLSEAQVQIIWLKQANPVPQMALPLSNADAVVLTRQLANIVRSCKLRYPNLECVFFSSRIYAGYATTNLNAEPYAYESAFSIRWLIESQIQQMDGGQPDPFIGDLDYHSVAPWLSWGPYLWADGLTPRSDGLTWQCTDFAADGTHPSQAGAVKVANHLIQFFLDSPFARAWFAARPFADLDLDGDQDGSDAEVFVEALLGTETDPAIVARSDFNGDGGVDGRDMQLLILALAS